MNLVICDSYGRIGNRLLLNAHVLACALENKVTCINPCLDEYAHYFSATVSDPLCRLPRMAKPSGGQHNPSRLRHRYANFFKYLGRKLPASLPFVRKMTSTDETLETRLDSPAFRSMLQQPGWCLLQGFFFRDYFALAKHRQQICSQFELVEHHAQTVQAAAAAARDDKDCILIGVHMRKGDYRNWLGGRYYFDDAQYAQVLARACTLFERPVRFFVASDEDIDLSKFAQFDCTKTTGHEIEDLYCLASCDFIIGPFSTYSSWASLYGDAPIYFIDDASHAFELDEFLSYEQFCIKHMRNSDQFPEYQ